MALALGPQQPPAKARHKLFLLLRTDKEKADHNPLPAFPAEAITSDWLDESADFKWLRRLSICRASLAKPARSFDRNYQRGRYYRALAAHRLARALGVLASGRMIITDRLHGHILCLLLGIPHIVFDNNYGKLGRFIETWTADCGLVERASNLAKALDSWKSTGAPTVAGVK
jgi:pyruvyl transferase EpsO